ncbi:relaxase/mobilization nuclease domain-containing protein [Acetoanaerobium noterae]|uniref:relaxase/mobilization nuclease domain-containing protein n=1 Tax=Acetoanaerobium noterae TaxID=745369 RepID=UPI0032217365
MAYVKIKPIHSNIEKALEYITNPDKTSNSTLVSSYGCSISPKDAKLEFEIVNKKAIKKRKDSVIARHLIQSFSPEDNITPELANKIGQELATEVLKNEYQYVVATHMDKGHIHNHIIFNTTSITENKKYRSNKYTYKNIQKISDRLCIENSLNVIPKSIEERKGKSYKEYMETKKGSSWKEIMKTDIDNTINKCSTFNEFIEEMKKQNYVIKQGKYISFKHPNQERFTRGKTLGEKYSEESIRYRISNPNKIELNKIIEINEKIKSKGAGFKKYAAKKNIEELSKMTKIMSENNINSLLDFNNLYKETFLKLNQSNETIFTINKKIEAISSDINLILTWKKTKDISDEYLKLEGNEKDKFIVEHQDALNSHILCQKKLKEKYSKTKIPKLSTLKDELSQLENTLKEEIIENYSLKQDYITFSKLKDNIKYILGLESEGEKNYFLNKKFDINVEI